MSDRNIKAALTVMAALAAAGGVEVISANYSLKAPRTPKMPLTDEEESKLSSLSGREKKKYVKELREKYKGAK